MARAKRWTRTVEEHGIQIRLFDREGTIYRDVTLGRGVSERGKPRTLHDVKSLGHGDRVLAVKQAMALATTIARNTLSGHPPTGTLTLQHLFAAYVEHQGPALKPVRLREAKARMQMFKDAWGADFPATDVDQTRINVYAAKRRNLEVVAPGLRLDPEGKRRRGYRAPQPVRDGALHGELSWLSTCFNWACGFKMSGRALLAANPLKGVSWPKEKNPRTPIASHSRYIATLAQTDSVDRSGALRCILALARYTGRRESAICSIRSTDLLFTPERIRAALAAAGMDERDAEHMPHGAIRWAAESDKQGFIFISPISGPAREELDLYLRRSPRIGDVPLFPAPKAPEQPICRETAAKRLLRAEKRADQPKLAGGVFHPYRRLWATERKPYPDIDVAAAGGWRDTRALKASYQKADPENVLRAVMAGR